MSDEKKFTEESIINKALNKCLCNLKDEREFYLNEDDFKFSFAQALKECGADEIILEYPITINDLYSGKPEVIKEIKKSERRKIDVRFRCQRKEVFVELKYKRRETNITRYGKSFMLSNHDAQNDGLYYIHLDIERMEAIRNSEKYNKCSSFCVFLTNDEYYKKPHKGNQNKKVVLCQGDNDYHSQAGSINYKEGNKSFRPLSIQNEYEAVFSLFKELPSDSNNNQFWIMVIDLQKPVTNLS